MGFTVVYAKWVSIAKQAAYCVLYAAVLLRVLFPTMTVPLVNVCSLVIPPTSFCTDFVLSSPSPLSER